MQSLARLRSDRYSSSSGGRLSGPLLQSYHGSPKHSFGRQQHSRAPSTAAAVVSRLVLVALVVAACFMGGKYLHRRHLASADGADAPGFLPLVSLGGSGSRAGSAGGSFWPSPADFNSFKIPRPSWVTGSGSSGSNGSANDKKDGANADPDAASKALKGTRTSRLFDDSGSSKDAARGGLGSLEVDSSKQQQADAPAPALPPSAVLPNQQQQQQPGAAASTNGARPGSSNTAAVPARAPAAPKPQQQAAVASSNRKAPAPADVVLDPLHDDLSDAEKEAEQLSALTRVIQQQQETIEQQAGTLQELQKRFDQQEHQLVAATASASATNGSEGVQVEPYFSEDKVQQELSMLHKVEAQIDAVAKSVDEATKALPNLTREQQMAQLAELERADQLMSRLSRVAAAINLRTADPLTESGHDPVVELRHYYGTVANDITTHWKAALARQSRPTADALGLTMDPFTDSMADLDTLDLRLEYVAAMMKGMHDAAPCRLGLVTTWSGDLWGLRKELIPWITYHAYLGVSRLYVLYEGSDLPTLRELLALKPWVTVTVASPPLATRQEVAHYDAWVNTVPDAHIKEWKSQPGNYHLMTKQGYAVTTALQMARADNVTWLMHLDPDELLHPGASHSAGMLAGSYSLLPELCNAPAHVPSIRFVNVEGVPEAADITNRYEQVTLFRAHRHLVPPQIQPFRYIFKQGHADAWLHLYTNGKSAVRPDAPGVTQGGPHVFLGPADKRWVTPDNPHGIWRPAISNSTLVLHYAYATPGDVAVKAGRSCPPGVVEAVLEGNTSQASQCFVLDLDQRAFLAAIKDRMAAGIGPVPPTLPQSTAPAASEAGRSTQGPIVVDPATYFGSSTSSGFSNGSWPVGRHVLDFFWGELALSEGAPFECLTPDGKSTGWCTMKDVDKLKSLLISSGLMMRLHAPAQTIKGIETAIQQLMLLGHRRASDKAIPEVRLASPAQAAESAMAAAAAGAGAAATPAAASPASGQGATAATAASGGGVNSAAVPRTQQQQPRQWVGATPALDAGGRPRPRWAKGPAPYTITTQQQQRAGNDSRRPAQPTSSNSPAAAATNEASADYRAYSEPTAGTAAGAAGGTDTLDNSGSSQQQEAEAGRGGPDAGWDRPAPSSNAAAAAAAGGAGAAANSTAGARRPPESMRAWFDRSNRPRGTYSGPGDSRGGGSGARVGYREPPRGFRQGGGGGGSSSGSSSGSSGSSSGSSGSSSGSSSNGRRLQQQQQVGGAGGGSGPSGGQRGSAQPSSTSWAGGQQQQEAGPAAAAAAGADADAAAVGKAGGSRWQQGAAQPEATAAAAGQQPDSRASDRQPAGEADLSGSSQSAWAGRGSAAAAATAAAAAGLAGS